MLLMLEFVVWINICVIVFCEFFWLILFFKSICEWFWKYGMNNFDVVYVIFLIENKCFWMKFEVCCNWVVYGYIFL